MQYTECESDSTAEDFTIANDEDQREQVLENLNALIHKEAKASIASDTQVPFQFDAVDFESLMARINPKLWSAVKTLTQTSQRNKSAEDEEASLDMHEHRIKNIRRYYCLCVLIFCANSRCHMPLHSLITDIVDSHGGSTELIRILNRLGVCSSIDTLLRRIQYITSVREDTGAEHECNARALAVTTLPAPCRQGPTCRVPCFLTAVTRRAPPVF